MSRSVNKSEYSGKNPVSSQRDSDEKDSTGYPLVSIVTVVLNHDKYIRKTIESVLQQSYPSVEYLVIDGGSKDNTVAIVREYEHKLAYWCSEPDNGISNAFNKGIAQSTGDIIGILNAGDWYEQDTVKKVVETFQSEQDTGVVCGALQFWHGEERAFVCQSVPRLLDRDMTITHPTCFVRRRLYSLYGLFSEEYRFAMDYELLLRFFSQGVKFTALEDALTNMPHEGVSERKWRKALRETHRARRKLMPGSFFATHLYYYFILMKRYVRIILENIGLNRIVGFYKTRLALVRKRHP